MYEERQSKGEFNTLVRELMLVDHEYFFRLFRMSPSTFEVLLSWVAPLIKKKSTYSGAQKSESTPLLYL